MRVRDVFAGPPHLDSTFQNRVDVVRERRLWSQLQAQLFNRNPEQRVVERGYAVNRGREIGRRDDDPRTHGFDALRAAVERDLRVDRTIRHVVVPVIVIGVVCELFILRRFRVPKTAEDKQTALIIGADFT